MRLVLLFALQREEMKERAVRAALSVLLLFALIRET
jgi:hypothetical protein